MIWANGPFQSVEFLITVALLMAVLLGGAVVIYFTDLWRKRRSRSTHEGIESLTMYREMYDNGEIEEAEYKVIRDRLAGRVKHDLAATSDKPASPASGANSADSASKPAVNPTNPEAFS
jgi:hypothetical protein